MPYLKPTLAIVGIEDLVVEIDKLLTCKHYSLRQRQAIILAAIYSPIVGYDSNVIALISVEDVRCEYSIFETACRVSRMSPEIRVARDILNTHRRCDAILSLDIDVSAGIIKIGISYDN